MERRKRKRKRERERKKRKKERDGERENSLPSATPKKCNHRVAELNEDEQRDGAVRTSGTGVGGVRDHCQPRQTDTTGWADKARASVVCACRGTKDLM